MKIFAQLASYPKFKSKPRLAGNQNSLWRNQILFCVGVYNRSRIPSIIDTYTKPNLVPNLGLVLTQLTTWDEWRAVQNFYGVGTFKNIGC